MSNNNFKQLADNTAEWICNNQIRNIIDPETTDANCGDMNFGRFVRNYSISQERILYLSSNWVTGMTSYGLLLMNDYTGEKKYLGAAENSMNYLSSLQRLVPGEEKTYGCIIENIPADNWTNPRDALSAAWGMLRLYMTTKNGEYLFRAECFAEWHLDYAMSDDGYPIWSVYFDERENLEFYGSFQAGSALFYYELYRQTMKPEYKAAMLSILDFFVENFWDDEKGLIIKYDPRIDYKGDSTAAAWSDMHKYNDDFATIALLNAYHLTGDKSYLNFATGYLDWITANQKENGSFGEYSLSISSCVAALNLLNASLITENKTYEEAAYKAVNHLKESIVSDNENPKINGGILGLNHCDISEENDTISLRVTMYALYTFVLFDIYENQVVTKGEENLLLDKKLLQNPMLVGLKFVNKPWHLGHMV
jgi:rhamnogalacturonyl hydrolase YesR